MGPHSATNLQSLTHHNKRGADLVIDVLRQHGIRKVFAIPGGTISPSVDALLDAQDVEVVFCRHENTAMFAAAGYAQASGHLAAVMVTSGPGVLNCVNGVASAFCDGNPVLVLVGEVGRTAIGHGAVQEGSQHSLDILGVFASITKYSATVMEASALAGSLSRAIRTSLSGRRGPSLLLLPVDVQHASVGSARVHAAGIQLGSAPEPVALSHAALALRAAHRGLILAGSGCRRGETPALLRTLAERLQMPVATTPKGKGVFPDSHPLALGISGWGGHSSVDDYVREGIDTLLVLGSSLGDLATHGWTEALRPSSNLIQVDIDASRLGKNYPVQIGIVASCEETLRGLVPLIPEPSAPGLGPILGVTRHILKQPEDGLSPDRVFAQLQSILSRDTLWISDIGDHLLFALHFLQIDDAETFQTQLGLGSMASGLGGAIGVQLAHPTRQVACICGDGGALMALGDFAVADTQKLPILYVLFNDRRYGMVENGHRALFQRTHAYPLESDRLGATLSALGLDVISINTEDDFSPLAQRLQARTRPLVLDIKISQEVQLPNTRLKTLVQGGAQ